MEELINGFTLQLCPGAFPLSTDSMALGNFVRLPKNAKVLDLGAGCGTLGLLLCARDKGCCVTGIELDENAHRMALENARRNQVQQRLSSICADLTQLSSYITSGSFDCCVSNPPYFASGFLSKDLPLARHEAACDLQALFSGAAWALKYGGDFFLVHKPERLSELFVTATQHKLEPKRLQLLRHRVGGAVTLVLVQFRKGAKPGLIWEEAALYDEHSTPTPYFKEIYHLQEEC